MGETPADILRAGYDAFNRRDFDAIAAFIDPGITFHEDPAFPEAGVYRGSEAVMAYWQEFPEVFDDFEIHIEEMIEQGDRVAVFVHETGRGKDSGAPAEFRIVHLWTIRDGTAVRLDAFFDRDRALRMLREGPEARV